MTKRTYRLWLLALYILGVIILAVPILQYMRSSFFTGLLPFRSPDEAHYLMRLNVNLLHPFANVADGTWRLPDAPAWLQVSFVEYVLGSFLSFTGLSGLEVGWWSMVFFAPLAIVFMAMLARRAGATEAGSLVAGLLYFCLMHYLRRMIHPSISLPLTTLSLVLLWSWWENPTALRAFVAGILAGLLVGVYFWSWTFVWASYAVLLVLLFTLPRSSERSRRLSTLWPLALGVALAAAPSIAATVMTNMHPLFAESADRMGMLFSRELESPLRSLMLLLLTISTFVALRKPNLRGRFAPLLAMITALLLVYNQQLIHGRIMSFSSHYYNYVCLVALLLLVFAIAYRKLGFRVWVLGLLACVPLIAGARDYNAFQDIFGGLWDDGTAHLGAAMTELQKNPGQVVLTDRLTGNIVGATTDNSVVFVEYARILLISTEQYIQRYCLSEALTTKPIDTVWVADVQEEKSRAARAHTKELFEKHLRMTEKICPIVKAHIAGTLKKFGVTVLLWNERLRPDWKPNTNLFRLQKRGEGWSVWTVKN